ncbi:hypothetical protein BN971_02593 [Mycobacterium bohemicum DSM 44277]|uniref:Lipoprotein n=1 Tax=Mycobacterium bohemicum DSM 44277 TaxID=1236609 RepID=A0A0U0W8Z3_MYCBE|nr:hypothetical protein [Mycobacterium bohemicum]CPR11313.1 hypothetical protein BN971_02593 [Mycobacterium bohemicum DSM 44277]
MKSLRRWARAAAAAGITGLSLTAAACGSATPVSSPTAATSTTATAPPVVVTDLAGKRYCEVLLVHFGGEGLAADVYNSYGLNDCPEPAWSALDAKQIAKDNGALAAVLNGPRYWLMDSIAKDDPSQQTKTFGAIAMRKEATVQIGDPTTAKQPYTPHSVDRQTVFTFNAGRQIYELVEPGGTRWVMQTWSQQKDHALAQADLANLGARLTPPAGWKYVVSTLSAPLEVTTTLTSAQVLQDDLGDSYSKRS